MGGRAGKCKECGATMIWATMAGSGKPNPLDPEPVTEIAAKKGQVAYNPTTGKAEPVTTINILDVALWVTRGATIHVSHWATCPERAAVRARVDANRRTDA